MWSYMDLPKVPWFLYQKRFHNKGHLNLVTTVLKGFSQDFLNIYFQVALKATLVSPDSCREDQSSRFWVASERYGFSSDS